MDAFVIDACCLINLYAAGNPRDVLKTSGGRWHIPSAVCAEALFLRISRPDGSSSREPADLRPLIAQRLVSVCEVEAGTELARYVALASHLDDGEAMALAIAQCRRWVLATDDRKAQRIAKELNVRLLTTPAIMKRWVDQTQPSREELRERLQSIEQRARFFPPAGDPLCKWWRSAAGT